MPKLDDASMERTVCSGVLSPNKYDGELRLGSFKSLRNDHESSSSELSACQLPVGPWHL